LTHQGTAQGGKEAMGGLTPEENRNEARGNGNEETNSTTNTHKRKGGGEIRQTTGEGGVTERTGIGPAPLVVLCSPDGGAEKPNNECVMVVTETTKVGANRATEGGIATRPQVGSGLTRISTEVKAGGLTGGNITGLPATGGSSAARVMTGGYTSDAARVRAGGRTGDAVRVIADGHTGDAAGLSTEADGSYAARVMTGGHTRSDATGLSESDSSLAADIGEVTERTAQDSPSEENANVRTLDVDTQVETEWEKAAEKRKKRQRDDREYTLATDGVQLRDEDESGCDYKHVQDVEVQEWEAMFLEEPLKSVDLQLLRKQRSKKEVAKIARFLIKHKNVLSNGTLDYLNNPDVTHNMTCDIKTTTDNPRIVSCNRAVSPEDRMEFVKQVEGLLKQGVVEQSKAPWSSNAVLVRKDGKIRMAIDYRQLNKVTVKDSYPMPRVQDLTDNLKGTKWFTGIDCVQAFHQIPMASERAKDLTTFRGPSGGLFRYR